MYSVTTPINKKHLMPSCKSTTTASQQQYIHLSRLKHILSKHLVRWPYNVSNGTTSTWWNNYIYILQHIQLFSVIFVPATLSNDKILFISAMEKCSMGVHMNTAPYILLSNCLEKVKLPPMYVNLSKVFIRNYIYICFKKCTIVES